jgi:isopenicillin N synthase-like dioxygenase
VINVGDCVEYLTNGTFRATRHRVSSVLPDERSVVVLFYEPSVEMPLKSLQKFNLGTEKSVKTECATFGEHLRKKLSSTYNI